MVRIRIRLTPRNGPDRVSGAAGGVLRVSVGAPPVDGAANLALVRLLARELDRPASAVRLVAGRAGRSKVVEIDGLERSAIEARWPNLGV